MKKVLSGIFLLYSIGSIAQDSTRSLDLSAYIESYFTYDLNRPSDNNRPKFIYNHNRHNEFNINLAMAKASYTSSRIRANLAMAVGTYMNANYVDEPGGLKNIFEANAGVKLGKGNFWLDMGVFSSHIGFESAISKDCWNLTRSILADNSPFFESGAKLTYTSKNEKWLLSALALNGWQRISRVNGNSLMSWGTQIQFKPTARILLNSSSFIGTNTPDSARLNRFFHSFYGKMNMTDKVGVIIGFDIGSEEREPGSHLSNTWYSPVAIFKYSFTNKWGAAGRWEYYRDKNGVIINTGTPNGFNTNGVSCNIDYSPEPTMLMRLEWRNLSSKDKIFERRSGLSNNNSFITTSISVSF